MAASLVPIGIGLAAILGLVALGGAKATTKKKKPSDKDEASARAAREAGFAAGTIAGANDANSGAPENLNPIAPEADARASGNAATYQSGFGDGYVDGFAAVTKLKKESVPGGGGTAWHPPGPASGLPGAMREGETAYTYGRRRGKNKGTEDCEGDYDGDPTQYYGGANFKARQAESGDAASYKTGFRDGYGEGFAGCQAAKALKEALPFAGVGSVATGFAGAVYGALKAVGVGARAPVMMISPRTRPTMVVAPRTSPRAETPERRAYEWGYGKGRRDALAGTVRDPGRAVAESDVARDMGRFGDEYVRSLMHEIVRGYHDGYARFSRGPAVVPPGMPIRFTPQPMMVAPRTRPSAPPQFYLAAGAGQDMARQANAPTRGGGYGRHGGRGGATWMESVERPRGRRTGGPGGTLYRSY